MKRWGLSVVLLCGALYGLAIAPPVRANTSLCGTNDQLFRAVRRPLATDAAPAARAMAWLKQMMKPKRNSGDGSTITPAQAYGFDYQAKVSGRFTLAHPRQTESATPLTVPHAAHAAEGYRGTVKGTAPTGANPREVRAYLYSDTEYEQATVAPAVVQPDGTWTLDLSPVNPAFAGSWHFRLYDKVTGQQIGESWPRPVTYKNLEVQLYAVSDKEYLQATQPAQAGNTFSFDAVGKGHKLIRLYDTATKTIIAEYFKPELVGLIRSYEYAPGQDGYGTPRESYSYVYDQSLALLVAIGADDRTMADKLVHGLSAIQVKAGEQKGAFPASVHQLDYTGIQQPIYYTGGIAFVQYALIRYMEKYGDQQGVRQMILDTFHWLETMKTTTGDAAGLFRGGVKIDNGVKKDIAWHATEHNTDMWHVYERAARVLGDKQYAQKADELAKITVAKLWNTSEGRFNQGYNDSGKALDTTSWGSIFLNAIGEYDKAKQALAYTASYKTTDGAAKGYTPYLTGNYVPTVWFEGTYGVAQAHTIAGDTATARAILADTYPAQRPNGAWQYASKADLPNELTNANSVASTAWYVLAASYPEVIWSECRAALATNPLDSNKPNQPTQPAKPSQFHGLLADTGISLWQFVLATAALLASGMILARYVRRREAK